MNKELMEALDVLEKEKEISKETLFEAIENSLMTACKNHFGKADNIHVEIKLFKPIDKCKEFSGILDSFDADTVTITEEGTPRTFARADVALIRLALDF